MAALLVALAVMAVMMSAVLPAWRHQAKREKEAELVFRGEQYVRAISLWERKMGPGSRPPNFDILVEQRFLRQKYKDPMTEDGEFLPVYAGTAMPGATPMPGGRGGRASAARIGGRGAPPTQQATPVEPGGPPVSGAPGRPGTQIAGGGIFGVMSKSKEASIRLYQGRGHYNEWRFVHSGAANAPGGIGGSPMPGGGGRATRPGQGTRGSGPPGTGPGRGRGPGAGPGRGPGSRPGPFPNPGIGTPPPNEPGPTPEPGGAPPGSGPGGGRGGRGPGGGF
jgi:hypothetical protein